MIKKTIFLSCAFVTLAQASQSLTDEELAIQLMLAIHRDAANQAPKPPLPNTALSRRLQASFSANMVCIEMFPFALATLRDKTEQDLTEILPPIAPSSEECNRIAQSLNSKFIQYLTRLKKINHELQQALTEQGITLPEDPRKDWNRAIDELERYITDARNQAR